MAVHSTARTRASGSLSELEAVDRISQRFREARPPLPPGAVASREPAVSREAARLRAPRLRLAHRCAAVLVDLHYEATGVVAAREPPQAFRAAEDDRVGVGPGLDREAFGELFVKKGVESVLPFAHHVDLARHLAPSMGTPGD
jgi:hypothetical protein